MFVVAAVCTIAALILRHSTWRIYWESGATTAVALMVGAALFASDTSVHRVAPILFHLTGIWHLDDFVAHVLFLCASVAFAAHIATRLNVHSVAGATLRWASPLVITVPVMFVALRLSQAETNYSGVNLDHVPPDMWLDVYRGQWSLTAIYLAVLIMRLAWRVQVGYAGLCRAIALAYVVAPLLIVAAGVMRLAQIVVASTAPWLIELPTWLCVIGGSMMALTAALSWILHVWPYRRLILAVRRRRALVLPGGDDGIAPIHR